MASQGSIGPLMEAFLRWWGALPPHFVQRLARWGGLFWYAVDRRHRRVAEDNLRLALGCTSPSRVRELAKANFVHLATVFLETLGVAGIRQDNCGSFITVDGLEFLTESLGKGKGLFVLTAHFGNWEWLAYVTPFYIKNRVNVIVRPLNSAWLNQVLTKLRERSGNRVIAKKQATRAIFKALQNNEMVAILLDQVASRGEGVYAPFFGVQVLTHRALAALAIKSGSPVHPAFIRRSSDGSYAVTIRPAIAIPSSGPLKDRVAQATALFNLAIERQIRTDPTQWYWIHRRFKRCLRNPGEPAS